MVSFTFVSAVAVLPLAYAQYYPPSNTTLSYAPSATATGAPAVQTVAVGRDGLVFTPDTITARVGEQIVFEFFPKNHSVVQADFNNPCNPAAEDPIFSGFIPTASGRANTTFTITVEDETPIWLYCAALLARPHCAAGMVAVINPPKQGPNTLDAFRELASRTNTSTAPGAVNGGQVGAPGAPGSPGSPGSPSPTGGNNPPQQTDSSASTLLASSGVMGLAALFAGLLM